MLRTKLVSSAIILGLGFGLTSCSTESKVARNGIKVRQEASLKNVQPGKWFNRSHSTLSGKEEPGLEDVRPNARIGFREYVKNSPEIFLAMNSSKEHNAPAAAAPLIVASKGGIKHQGFKGLAFLLWIMLSALLQGVEA